MLSTRHEQVYKDFVTTLMVLREHLNYFSQEIEIFKRSFGEVESIFQEQILSLTSDGLESDQVSRWQLVHTEIHRAFRLLKTDFLFLVSAKQEVIMQQRAKKFGDRLEKLISDCQIVLNFRETGS
jgi:hypothetical protein